MTFFDFIIFDCDGTLVDSEQLNCQSCSDVFIEAGFTDYTVDVIYKELVGVNLGDMCRMIEKKHGRPVPADITEKFVKKVQENAGQYLRALDGALAAVEYCAVDYGLCVASNGEPENVLTSIKAIGFDRFINDNAVFTANMVDRPKPEPDLFLHACKSFGHDPLRSLVIEDTVTGVKAAKAAGMSCIGIVQAHKSDPAYAQSLKAAGADYIINHWSEFYDVLKIMNTALEDTCVKKAS